MALIIQTTAPKRLLRRLNETLAGKRDEWLLAENGDVHLRLRSVVGGLRPLIDPRKALIFGVVPSPIRHIDTVSFAQLHLRLAEVLLVEHDREFTSLTATAGLDATYDRD